MARERGWTEKRIAYAAQLASAKMAAADAGTHRDMTVELTLANGALVPYVYLFEYNVSARTLSGLLANLIPNSKLQVHFAAEVGKVYLLWVKLEGHPTGTAKLAVYYPPMPAPGNPHGPVPAKGDLATDWPPDGGGPFFVPVPSAGVIQ